MRVAALSLVALLALPASASRGGVTYDLSIAGAPIGSASLMAAAESGRYSVGFTGDLGFLFWGGVGDGRSEGTAGAALTPLRYRLDWDGPTRDSRVEIDFDGAAPVRWDRQPPPDPEWLEGRVEILPAHLAGAADPLSALVVPAPLDADPATLCGRTLRIFTGMTRFDVRLSPSAAAPAAPVDGLRRVACAAAYEPVSGHRSDSASVERLRRPEAVRLTLAPLAPGLWGPDRVAVATRFWAFEAVRR